MAISDGLYEIRSALDPTMALDVSGASAVKGANIQLYSVNHTNAQVFYIDLEDTDSWSVRNLFSEMYMDVYGASATSGSNVQQWTDNDTRAQRWRIVDTGETMTIDTATCQIVKFGSYVTNDADSLYLDVKGALTTNKTNVQIWTKNGTDAQVFVLFPTVRTDEHLPQPDFLGMASTGGGSDWSYVHGTATTIYPGWIGTQSWASNTSNGFRWRYERRYMTAATSTWTDWESVSPWYDNSSGLSHSEQTWWLTSGLSGTFDTSTYKAMQYMLVVLSYAGTGSARAYSPALWSDPLTIAEIPTVTLSAATFGPQGLLLTYSSSYDGGVTNIGITSVKVSGQEMLAKPVTFDGQAVSGTVLVPTDALAGWISSGSTATITYQTGSDIVPLFPNNYTKNLTVSYSGGGLTVNPTLAVGYGRVLNVSSSQGTLTGAWTLIDGELVEAEINNGTANVMYPFGTNFDLFVAVQGQSSWGYKHIELSPSSSYFAGTRPCHAFNWDGGSFLIELREGQPLSTGFSMTADSESFMLNGRDWESTHFGSVVSGTSTVQGSLIPHVTESQREQAESLIRAHHVTYRSPVGDVWDVAVTDIAPDTQNGWSNVSVTFRRESR